MSNITSATKPITIDGIEYQVSPVTIEILEYLDNWMMGRMMRAARLSVEDDPDVTPARRHEVLVAAGEAAMGASAFSGNGLTQLMSPVGSAVFLQKLMQPTHPDITKAQCFGWMMRKDVQDELRGMLLSAFRGAKDGDIEGAKPDPTKGGPSTKDSSSESSSQPESKQIESAK